MVTPEEHTSPDGALTLEILEIMDIGDGDYTIGFRGYEWHTHPDILASISGLSEAEAVRAYIDAILAGESIIAVLSVDGAINYIWITDDPQSDLKYLEPNETIQFRNWSGRPYMIQ